MLDKFTMPAADWDETRPDINAIRHLITKHQTTVADMQRNYEYYIGNQAILDSDNATKLVCNHAKDICDTASSYFIGVPITYKSKNGEDISKFVEAIEAAGADEADGDNGLSMSIYGVAYEYIYTTPDDTTLTIKNLDARNTFIVYDDTIEENELFAVYYYEREDDTDRRTTHYIATVLTQNYKHVFDIQTGRSEGENTGAQLAQPEAHYKGEIPVVMYKNNKLGIGDFELQIPLIDAYNVLMSDRVTDKEQYIDAILAIYGTLLSDDEYVDEAGNIQDGAEVAIKKLKRRKLLELPDGTKAEYITRTYDESGVEILRRAIEQDIHKFSHIPCITDEHFAGNVSGVAMEFKLYGLDNVTKIKTRYYRQGLKKRYRIFANFHANRALNFDPESIEAVFSRGLPKNVLEISQIINNLWGKVSRKTLISQVPFVEDPDYELETVDKENEEAMKKQQEMMQEAAQESVQPGAQTGAEEETETTTVTETQTAQKQSKTTPEEQEEEEQ